MEKIRKIAYNNIKYMQISAKNQLTQTLVKKNSEIAITNANVS